MRYEITDKFGIKKLDTQNWCAFEIVTRKAKQDTKDGKKEGETYKDDNILGYAGDIQSAYRMMVKLIPNYIDGKSELTEQLKLIADNMTRGFKQ